MSGIGGMFAEHQASRGDVRAGGATIGSVNPELSNQRQSILFVCLGNICRSPTAEGVFKHLARERGMEQMFHVESAGTGEWHIGALPDPRTRAAAQRKGLTLTSRAQLVEAEKHFAKFDLLIALDRSIRTRLLKLGAPAEKVKLLREFDPEVTQLGSNAAAGESGALWNLNDPNLDVPDPYHGPEAGFDEVFEIVRRSCEGLLQEIGH